MALITSRTSLNYGTEFTMDIALKTITLSVAGNLSNDGATGKAIAGAIHNAWKAQAGFEDKFMPVRMADGPIGEMLILGDGWTIASGLTLIRSCGLAYEDGGTITDEWMCIQQGGSLADQSHQPYYSIGGATPVNLNFAGDFNELVKIYESGSFDHRSSSFEVFVYEVDYTKAYYNLVTSQQLDALTYRRYLLPMSTAADASIVTSAPSGAPYSGMSITLGATTNTINSVSRNFAVGELDANSGTVQQVYDWFQYLKRRGNSADIDAGAGTQRGDTFSSASLTLSGGILTTSQGFTIKNIAAADLSNIIHVDDTGTGRQEPATGSAEITNLPTTGNTRLWIRNRTQATTVYNGVPTATYSDTFTEGTTYAEGDEIEVRFAAENPAVSFQSFGSVFNAGAGGTWALNASNLLTTNSAYATLGIDGSAVTGHTADHTNDEADLTAAANWDGRNTQAWLLHILTTANGIEDFWGGYTIATGEILIHNAVLDMWLDNTTTTNIRETSNIKIHRDDGAYPVRNNGATTSGGGGITVRHLDPVITVNTGSVNQTTLLDVQATINAMQSVLNVVDQNVDDVELALAGTIDANVTQVAGSTAAATAQSAALLGIVSGQAVSGTLSTVQASTNLTEATDDHYNNSVIVWTSGVLAGQRASVTDYDGVGKVLTFSTVTEAPSPGDTFVIV